MDKKDEEMQECPVCKGRFPIMTEDGKHNFCPASDGGKIIHICMGCKVGKTVASRAKASKRNVIGKGEVKW